MAFTAAASGQKLKLFSLIPRVKPIPELDELDNVISENKTNSTFNNDMIIKYLERVINPYRIQNRFEKVLLIIDSAPCHLTPRVKASCELNGIVLFIIPPRLTNLLQPADVCWFSSIKKRYREKWNRWFE